MAEEPKFKNPCLIGVWPGMGQVAMSAGYYLMAKLGMYGLAEFSARELFDVENVDVKGGLISSGRLPRSRLFAWNDPRGEHDVLVFIGEAQPPLGRYLFCRKLLDYAKQLGAERVFTFAAMVTQMHPERSPRVFAAATDAETLAELRKQEVEVLEEGQIGGLNGVLLGVAAEMGMRGGCLLGEVPHMFAQFPYPAASLAVLRIFKSMAGLELDLSELEVQSQSVSRKLAEIWAEVERNIQQQQQQERDEEDEGETFRVEPEEPRISPADERRIEAMFETARQDRSKAYELKSELDRLGVFDLYEDQFLDLFKPKE